jgi:beta-lactamase regulating signal transducer with metallopeptidase domain
MNEILVRLATATLLLSVSAVVVQGLILVLRPSSARVRQCAWFCVLIQGIVLFHLPVRVPWYDPPPDDRFDGRTQCVQEISAESMSVTRGIDAETAESESVTPTAQTTWPSQPSQVTRLRNWSMVAVALWLSGIAGLIIVSGLSYVVFLRQLAQGRPGPSDWSEELRELLQQRGIVRTISLLVTRSIGPALCWAPWSYRICVPGPSWAKLASAQRRHILRHELAHFRRSDLWWLLLVRLLALPHWFNPFAWWAVHQISQSVEWACDQEAAGREPQGALSLAKALIQLGAARSLGGCPVRAAGRSSLYVRIRRLMLMNSRKDSLMKKVLILAVAATLVAINLVRIELVAKESEAGTPTLEGAPTNSGAADVVSLSETAPKDHWSLTLKETLRCALQNSNVMRQIGAQIQGLRTLPASNPTSESTIGKPAKAMPGVTEAVIIARANTDISLAVFEKAVRNLVSDVGVAYWELYFAYRNLESAVQGRDRALRTWQKVKALGPAGEKASAEAQARQQYFLFCTTAEQAQSQVYQNESKLRYMMGIVACDGRLIRPADDPTTAKVSFDWAGTARGDGPLAGNP